MTHKSIRFRSGIDAHYGSILGDISGIIAEARGTTIRSVNCVMTATYWLIGRRIVEGE